MPTTNPNHAITITPYPRRVRVSFGGQVIVDTHAALQLQEGAMAPVLYLPRRDATMAALSASPRKTHCPFKGEASYFNIAVGDQRTDNAIWSYEAPLPEVAAIAGHLAFYKDRVTIEDF